uniref:Uncharacterized protein n=1 Tax=Lactuca sativa TaxID=4236 RepID=A0A9R1XQ52_LACSA|nr:hypothetical protein LSAT_V11C200058870 [Lactuca sativa]
MFTDSVVPPTTSTIPLVSANVSDMGAKTSGFSTPVSPPVSPLSRNDPDMMMLMMKILGDSLTVLSKYGLRAKSQEIRTDLKDDHKAFQPSISSQISKIRDELRVVMRSCITDVTSMLSDILETRDSMLTITVRKHLLKKVRPVFAMLHRLEGVSDQSFNQKQGGEGKFGDSTKESKEDPKAPVKHVAPGKETLFCNDPIVDNSEEEEVHEPIVDNSEDKKVLDENELKRRKACEAEMDEHQRIIR